MNKTEELIEKIAEFLSISWPDSWEDMPDKIKEIYYDSARGALKICKESGLGWSWTEIDYGYTEEIDV